MKSKYNAAAHALPRLRYFVQHVLVQQIPKRRPVSSIQRFDVALNALLVVHTVSSLQTAHALEHPPIDLDVPTDRVRHVFALERRDFFWLEF